ncbi:MAG: hypothetical protein EAZ91_19805 [Cytophagales bacterium]|nr:MAG: hypothetical protein EAZ91_19805 [Cytophagales bacterium]
MAHSFVAFSQTKTWTGAVSVDWHTAGNWSPSGVPTASDVVLLPAISTIQNQPALLTASASLSGLIIDNSGADYQLVNNAPLGYSFFIGRAGLTVQSPTGTAPYATTIGASVQMLATQTWSVSHPVSTTLGRLVVTGRISGNTALTKSGNAILQPASLTNTYTGGTFVNEGVLLGNIDSPVLVDEYVIRMFGTASRPIVVANAATLALVSNGKLTLENSLTLAGSGAEGYEGALWVTADQNLTPGVFLRLDGDVTLAADVHIYRDCLINVQSDISGPGNLTLNGPDIIRYDRPFQTNYGQRTTVTAGALVYAGRLPANTDLFLGSPNSASAVSVDLVEDDLILNSLASSRQAEHSLFSSSGTVDEVTLTINQATNTTYWGNFCVAKPDGSIKLVKQGVGTLNLGGDNVCQSDVVIEGGRLQLINTLGSATGTGFVWVEAGGTLSGTGVSSGTLTVANSGTVAPGTGTGSAPGSLRVGPARLSGGGAMTWRLNNATPAVANQDRLVVNGLLDLSGLTSANRFVIQMQSLGATNQPGSLPGFVSSNSYSWTIATFSSLSLPAGATLNNLFTLNRTGFTNLTASNATFTIVRSGNALVLRYDVPCAVTMSVESETICRGSSANITASGCTGGTVVWPAGFTGSGLTRTASFTITTNYTLTCTVGGCTTTATGTLTVRTPPTVNLSAANACVGQAVSLSATSGLSSYTFSWSGGVIAGGATANTRSLSGVSAGTYSFTVRVANTNGCTNTATDAATVVALPTPTLTASPSRTLTCAVRSLTLTAGGGGSYAFARVGGGAGLVSQNSASGTAVVNASGTYAVTVTNNGCSATTSTSISSNTTAPPLTLNLNTGTLTCATTRLILTPTTSATGVRWNTGAVANSLTVTTSGTYSLTATGANGCTATATSTITSDTAAPMLTVTPGSGTLTCASTSLTLTAATSGTGVRWNNNTTSLTRVVNSASTYSVTATSANGCRSVSSVVVSQDGDLPTLDIVRDAGPPASGVLSCAQPSLTLTAISSATALRWSTNATSTTLAVNVGGTYSVTATAPNGCSVVDSAVITANSTPLGATLTANQITGPPSTTITCANPILAITATGSGDDFRFARVGGGGIVSQQDEVIQVNLSGTYSVTIIDTNSGCSSTTSIQISQDLIPPTLSINPISGTLTCASPTLTLTATSSASDLLWNDGTTGNQLTVNVADDYSVLATAPNGCTALRSVTINQSTVIPTVNLSPSSETLTCGIRSVTLTATSGATSFTFRSGTPASPGGVISSTGNMAVVTTAGDYFVIVSTPSGCTATDNVTLFQTGNLPSANLVASNGGVITCAETTLTLTETANGGSTDVTYAFSGPGLNQSGSDNLTTIDQTGLYSVTVTDANGCSQTATTTVTANTATPTGVSLAASNGDVLTCAVPSVTLTASPAGAASYAFNGVAQSGNTLVVNNPDTYTVTVFGTNGCSATASVGVTQNVDLPSVTLTANNNAACPPVTLTLTAQPGTPGSYSYVFSAGATQVSGPTSPTATVTGSGSYSVTIVSGSNGCSALSNAVAIRVGSPRALTVNSTADTPDANVGDGVCADASGNCTLRAAVEELNASNCGSTLVTLPANQTIGLDLGELEIRFSGTITSGSTLCPATGAGGTTIRRVGPDPARLIYHQNGNLTLRNLTFENGSPIDDAGGAITSENCCGGSSLSLVLENCVFRNNWSGRMGGNPMGSGGALYCIGMDVSIANCLFTDNNAERGKDIAHAKGTLRVTNTTFTNTTPNGTGIDIGGGTALLTNCTFYAPTSATAAIVAEPRFEAVSLSILHSTFHVPNFQHAIMVYEDETGTFPISTHLKNNLFGQTLSSPIRPVSFTSLNIALAGGNVFAGDATAQNSVSAAVTLSGTDRNNVGAGAFGLIAPVASSGECIPTVALACFNPANDAGGAILANGTTDARGTARTNPVSAGAYEGNTGGPVAFSVSSSTVCSTVASLTASGCTGGTVNWPGGTTGNLFTANQSGPYTATCTVGGCSTTATGTVLLGVGGVAPTLLASSSATCAGTTVQISATLNTPATGYQWYRNGVSLGAIGQSLTLTLGSVQPNQSGNYVLNTTGLCSATSSAFALTVNPIPTVLLTFPSSATVQETGTPTVIIPPVYPLTVRASGGVFYEWMMVLDRINGYEIRQTDQNTTGLFPINRTGRYWITVTDALGCQRRVEGLLINPPR